MSKNRIERISVYLSYLLRHDPNAAELNMDRHGWVDVSKLIQKVNSSGKYSLSMDLLKESVWGVRFWHILRSSSLFRQVLQRECDILSVEVMNLFCHRIRKLRVDCGMSQREVAKRLNMSVSAIGMYEQGRRFPSLDLVVAYADLFSVTTDYLLRGDSNCTEGKTHRCT